MIHLSLETILRLNPHSHKHNSEPRMVRSRGAPFYAKTPFGFLYATFNLGPALGSGLMKATPTQGTERRPQPCRMLVTYRICLRGLILRFGFYINNSVSVAEGALSKNIIKWQFLGF